MPSMHIARSGSTGGTHEYPAGHREVRIDVNRLVTSVSTAHSGSHVSSPSSLTHLRAAGLPWQDAAVDSSATKFERYAVRPCAPE